jgi:hypothetical protein
VLHRKALGVTKMTANMKNVLDDTVKIVNHIKSNHLNATLLTVLCEEIGSEHTSLVLHTEVRCFSGFSNFAQKCLHSLWSIHFIHHIACQDLRFYRSWHTLRTFPRRSINKSVYKNEHIDF